MKTLDFQITINSPAQKVWDILFGKETYGEWTQFFMPGSQMKTDWQINGKTYFVDANGDGMVSTIKTLNEPHEVIFSHLGFTKDGVEDTSSKEIMEWSGAQEKYFLREVDGITHLRAEVQIDKNWEEVMNNGFTKGFEVVKKLAEE
jgi:uncharacterized protein YndB with AHSA1/START domain